MAARLEGGGNRTLRRTAAQPPRLETNRAQAHIFLLRVSTPSLQLKSPAPKDKSVLVACSLEHSTHAIYGLCDFKKVSCSPGCANLYTFYESRFQDLSRTLVGTPKYP